MKKENVNQVGQIFDPKKSVCREFDLNEINQYIKSTYAIAMSWGFNSPGIVIKNKCLRFTVNGHHHKGYVYIVLDFMDTFTIYYTNKKDEIKKVREMVYIDMLIDILDTDIEKIPAYTD